MIGEPIWKMVGQNGAALSDINLTVEVKCTGSDADGTFAPISRLLGYIPRIRGKIRTVQLVVRCWDT